MRVDEMAARSVSCSMTHFLNTPRITENVRRSQKSFLWKVQQSVDYSKFTQVREILLKVWGCGAKQRKSQFVCPDRKQPQQAVHWVMSVLDYNNSRL